MQNISAMMGGVPFRAVDNGDGTYSLATSASYGNATPLTVGTAAAPGKEFLVAATAAGNITLTLSGGGSIALPVAVGITRLPLAVTEVTASTATATYLNLS
jgi:hypothetical protein